MMCVVDVNDTISSNPNAEDIKVEIKSVGICDTCLNCMMKVK